MPKDNLQLDFDAKNKILDNLNEAQLQAVTHKDGPLLIIAGAGTGKTSVITRRIAYIIEQKWALPSEILALTFTEKAASEMEERVDMLVPYGYTDMWISTFHAFGDRFLRDYSLDLGLPANFKVLTATEQAIFMRQHLFAFDLEYYRPIASPTTHIKSLLSHFSRLKDELISPELYLDFAQKDLERLSKENNNELLIEAKKRMELANAYLRYQELMIQSGNLDYGDQIYLTHKVLKENPSILKEIQKRFKYVMVDEFQDTNYAQNELVKLLASKSGNITVVGDDDQSIYRFRGASISNIMQFKEDYPKTTQVVLNQNYRSSQEILDASYRLIQHNNPDRLEIQNKIDKRLIAQSHGAEPELLHCATLSCEADIVTAKIIELKNKYDFKYKDFAVLVRANNHADAFIQSFNISSIPFLFSGSSSLLQQPEIKMIISFLRCLINPEDNLSFFHLATSECYNVDSQIMASIYSKSRYQNRSIEDILSETEEFSLIINIKNDLENYRRLLASDRAGEILYKFLTDKDILKKWIASEKVADEIKIYHIASFFERIANFDHASNDKSLPAFLSALELIIEAGDDIQSSELDSEIDAVNILTAHASKGLEYSVVFVVNAVADRFPARKRSEGISIPNELIKERLPEGDFHMQEERRLFYVAATRAKQFLFISAADDYGGKRIKKLSPFVLELFDQPNPTVIKHRLSPAEKIERYKKITAETVSPSLIAERKSNLKLSRQQIDDYFTCPQKYYLTHVIRIPLLENQYLMYGTAIHSALDHYFTKKIRGQKSTLDELILDYKAAFHSAGFITREHEDQRYTQGIDTLAKFYDNDTKDTRVPESVESIFEFSENGVKVNGRYDLIYNNNNEIEICDFKTSAVKDQKDADDRIRKSTQMQMYALSWFLKNNVIPKTTLYFIESGLKGERIFSQKELEKTKEMIEKVACGVKEQNYQATPNQRDCVYCTYKDICPSSLA